MNKLFRKIFPDKEFREFRKMHRRHRKELIKLAKETAEYDWCWLHQMVMLQIKQMHEYYSAGDNVWQTDETRLPIIKELKHVLDLEDERDNTYDSVKEQELLEDIYEYIGKNIQNWWD